MSVRITRTSDTELVRELHTELFPTAPLTDEELEGSEWWIATLDDVPVAFAGIQAEPTENRAFLIRAGVQSHVRGGGIQKRLINVRKRYAKKHGFASVYTYVWAGNFASMRSLISCNFKPYKVLQHDGATFLYLQHPLN